MVVRGAEYAAHQGSHSLPIPRPTLFVHRVLSCLPGGAVSDKVHSCCCESEHCEEAAFSCSLMVDTNCMLSSVLDVHECPQYFWHFAVFSCKLFAASRYFNEGFINERTSFDREHICKICLLPPVFFVLFLLFRLLSPPPLSSWSF